MNDDDTPEPYTLPDNDGHPATYAARVMKHPTHAHLAENEITLGWLMRTTPKLKAGKVTLGSIHDTKTMAQGGFKDLFTMMLERLLGFVPQYVVVIDAGNWSATTELKREVLVFHVLLQCRHAVDSYGSSRFDKDGVPVYELCAPDIQEFNATIERYGAYSDEVNSFLAVCNGSSKNTGW